MIRLAWTEFRVDLIAEAPWVSPGFPGSMHRGALATALRRLVCVMRRRHCTGCPLLQTCLYPRLFETRPDPRAEVMRRYDRAPHPLVLVAALRGEDGDCAAGLAETIRGRIFGPDMAAMPFLLRAAEDAAGQGLGATRVPFRVAAMQGGAGPALRPGGTYPPPVAMPPPPALPARRRWRLASPLRLQVQGRPLDAATITGPLLGRAVLRRVGLMAEFYGAFEEEVDFEDLAREADRLRIAEARLAWRPLRRWSSRQAAQQSISGLVGEIVLDFADAPRLARLADWIPLVHLGKETSMGLGHVTAEAA